MTLSIMGTLFVWFATAVAVVAIAGLLAHFGSVLVGKGHKVTGGVMLGASLLISMTLFGFLIANYLLNAPACEGPGPMLC